MYNENYETDFTERAWDSLYSVVDHTYFRDQDAHLIYEALEHRLKYISFGEYLKRYIYRKAEFTVPYEQISLKEYQAIIRDSFADNHTPASFTATTAKLSALSKNWLTQQTVRRKVVFLLGFGLAMSEEEVNEFLTKALREQGINAKNPFEVICWYCYKNHYNFLKFQKLWASYHAIPVDSSGIKDADWERTINIRRNILSVTNDFTLIQKLYEMKLQDREKPLSVTARKYFYVLYNEARKIVAQLYNQDEQEKQNAALRDYINMLERNDRLSDHEKQKRILERRKQRKVYQYEDITESDMEHILCSSIPVDRHGNLTPGKASKLNEQFAGKRFSRQHIREILSGKTEINRFDLITLNFFIFSQNPVYDGHPKKRYVEFLQSMNKILESCYLAPVYTANPYECFILMCILSDDPLGTYADVWELSFDSTF